MKKLLICLLICLPLWNSVRAQTDTAYVTEAAMVQARVMADAYLQEEYDRCIDFMHPRLTDMLGGRDTLVKMFRKTTAQGIKTTRMEILRVKGVMANDTSVQCVLDQEQEMMMFGTEYITKGNLIGISYDKGIHWYFINVATNSIEELQKLFPELIGDLPVKPQDGPRFKKN